MRFGDLGAPELLLIVVALVLVFGASKLGDVGGALGTSIREFRRAMREEEPAANGVQTPASPPAITDHRPAP